MTPKPGLTANNGTLKRRLTAIVVADVVGYSQQMAEDEEGTFTRVRALMHDEIPGYVHRHDGRVVKNTGDGIVAEFLSAVEAVRCGVAIQAYLASPERPSPGLSLRMGINFGDIIVDGDGDVFGDGVNVAARLEQIAAPGGICLSAKVHEEVRAGLQLPFEYCGDFLLKNIPRPVAVYSLIHRPESPSPSIGAEISGSNTPSILVRPFVSTGGVEPYFSEGFTEDVITELTRFTQLSVASYHTSMRLKDVELPKLVSDIGLDFELAGRIRRMGKRIRLSCELVDATSGGDVWAEHYDSDDQDIFDVQDELVRKIVGTVIGRLKAAGAEKARRKPPANLAAYECVLRGNALPLGDLACEAEARQWYQRAIDLDPTYGRAYAKLAHYKQLEWFRDMGSSDALLDEAHAIAKKAVALSPNDPVCLNILGWVLLHRRDFDVAAQLYARALYLNPNDPEQVSYLGTLYTFCGEPDRAMQWFERAQVLDPLYEPSWYWPFRGIAHFIAGRPEPALVALSRSSTMPTWVTAYMAASSSALGRDSDAKLYAARVLAGTPSFSCSRFVAKEPYRLEEDRATLFKGLLAAGLPN